MEEVTKTPEECQKKISDSKWTSYDEVSLELDKMSLVYGFKVAKMSGG